MPRQQPDSSGRARSGIMRDVVFGARIARRGFRAWGTSPRLMMWGVVPGLVTAVLFIAVAIVVATQLARWSESIANALVSADGAFHTLVQIVAAVGIVAGVVLIAVYTFTAITLAIGQPFFERISRAIDSEHGFQGSDHEERWHRAAMRGLGEVARLSLLTVPLALGLFVVGWVPVVGSVAAFVLGASCGGWFLALELTTYPLARRGVYTLAQRRAVLRRKRALVVGFGSAVFMAFLIPFGAALLMPAAVAGATRLVHEVDTELEAAEGSGGAHPA